jgi:hypothetical protein
MKLMEMHDIAVQLKGVTKDVLKLRNRAVLMDDETERANLFNDVLLVPRIENVQERLSDMIDE